MKLSHGGEGDGAYLFAYAGAFRQLVNDLRLDKRGVHIDADQPSVAAEHIIALEGDVDPFFFGYLHQFALQRLAVGQIAAEGEFDTGMAFLHRHVNARTLAQAQDVVNIQLAFSQQSRHAGYMARIDLARQHGHHIAVLFLPSYPSRIFLFAQRRETDNHLQSGAAEKDLFDHIAGGGRIVPADENTEVELVVEVRLTDVLHISAVLAQHFCHSRCHTRFVKTDDVD